MKKHILVSLILVITGMLHSMEIFRINFDSLEAVNDIRISAHPDLLSFDFGITAKSYDDMPSGMMVFTRNHSIAFDIKEGMRYMDLSYFANGYTFPPEPGGYQTLIVSDAGHHLILYNIDEPDNSTISLTYNDDDFYLLSFNFSQLINDQGDATAIDQLNGIYTAQIYIDYDGDGLADPGEYKRIQIRI